MARKPYPTGNEKKFNEFLVEEYLKVGSVDEVLKIYKFDLPISYAGYQRILDKWGMVKAAGPNNTLGEALNFLTKLAYDNIPFERVYRKMPLSFQTSAATLYRILGYMKEGVTRRLATGLVITTKGSKKKVLVAKDVSNPRVDLGKIHGMITIPMGFSRRRDPREMAIKRILQQEVFTKLTIQNKFPKKIIPPFPKPFMFLDIADVRVEVFHIELPKRLTDTKNFSSFKLKNYKFVNTKDVIDGKFNNLRVGVKEAVEGFEKHKRLKGKNLSINPLQETANVNTTIISTD
jgi:hypothetical protein